MSTPEKLTLAFAQATADYLIVIEENGRLVYANPAFVGLILGGAPAAGQDLFSLVDPSSAERGHKAIAALAEGPQRVELYHQGKDGRLHSVHYSFCRVEGGVAGVGRDRTPDLQLLGEIVQLNLQLEEKQKELAEANARLEQLATTDHITGLYNRHYLFGVVQHLFEEARRYGLPLCCMMMDLDHFKSLNDRFGHLFGDQVLKTTAERLLHITRRSDVLARYGGEEFVLVTPNTDLRTGLMLAERLRQTVAQEPFMMGEVRTTVTASLGLSGTELVPSGPFSELLESADQALYAAKHGGRNRYCVYKPAATAGLEQAR